MIRNVLFDLDGTLLPMDTDLFTKIYFGSLTQKMAPFQIDPKQFVATVWKGTEAMVKNDGSCLNSKRFWDSFSKSYPDLMESMMPLIDEYYTGEFSACKSACSINPQASEAVEKAKALGYRVALATNPIFPQPATLARIDWAGLKPEDFEFITTYETSRYCKPNPAYYMEVLETLDMKPEETLMVGNDLSEDIPALKTGMSVFIVTDCLLHEEAYDLEKVPHGSFADLIRYLEEIRIRD